jgi:hypothetical protein
MQERTDITAIDVTWATFLSESVSSRHFFLLQRCSYLGLSRSFAIQSLMYCEQ